MQEFSDSNKIQLSVLGLSSSPSSGNAYALILKESRGNRRLPIVIGAYEAQAIALEMEGVTPPRPMTHDLMKTIIDSLGAILIEVVITDLNDGTFFAKLVLDSFSGEIDARPSDAIALAVRCGAPIYAYEEVIESAGLEPPLDDENNPENDEKSFFKAKSTVQSQPSKSTEDKLEQLNTALGKAIDNEDYEKAAKIRDEIKKLKDIE